MESKTILKQDIAPWLESLADKFEVFAPVTEEGVTRFKPVSDISSADFASQSKALRELFTPETETLFEYRVDGTKAEIKEADVPAKERLVLGARACDAAALKYVDAVYSMVKPIDTPYFDRRARTTIIGMFCSNPWWSCFCTEVNDCLVNPIEMDANFVDIGDKYFVEVFTPKGEELFSAPQFNLASDADKQAVEDVKKAALSKLPAKKAHDTACLSYDWDHAIWQKLAQKCMGCGICAFSCPTCHCFDIMECSKGKSGNRFRCWDTCQFEKFTTMGHGHNPRPSKTERTRQRVFHKFKYSVERYGMLGCVGCGRCIALCPVGIDIAQVVNELEKV